MLVPSFYVYIHLVLFSLPVGLLVLISFTIGLVKVYCSRPMLRDWSCSYVSHDHFLTSRLSAEKKFLAQCCVPDFPTADCETSEMYYYYTLLILIVWETSTSSMVNSDKGTTVAIAMCWLTLLNYMFPLSRPY